jgi:hypothetical protein
MDALTRDTLEEALRKHSVRIFVAFAIVVIGGTVGTIAFLNKQIDERIELKTIRNQDFINELVKRIGTGKARVETGAVSADRKNPKQGMGATASRLFEPLQWAEVPIDDNRRSIRFWVDFKRQDFSKNVKVVLTLAALDAVPFTPKHADGRFPAPPGTQLSQTKVEGFVEDSSITEKGFYIQVNVWDLTVVNYFTFRWIAVDSD